MRQEESRSEKESTTTAQSEESRPAEVMEYGDFQQGSKSIGQRSKLSLNVSHEISERLRSLAYSHRLSESSIVEVALTMFFARGDDAVLGAILKQLGASLRRK
jgi:hypothetical protein